ncbi:coiled-coil domain-containing protein [Stieleria varia]|uniref:Uncharacterized protein n=1 Tax=Stieleria varia TaxID=2528005 RepID=A0A5C6B1E0_9BACT|nr:hypothetical protein [Stieleria varia]TWU05627.1 hypothetical protein Pla52n_13420 [Stieleria varia]
MKTHSTVTFTRQFFWGFVITSLTLPIGFTPCWSQESQPTDRFGFPVATGLDVSVVLHAERDPAVSDSLLTAVQNRVERLFVTVLGAGATVDIVSRPAVDEWLGRNSIEQLTAAQCRLLGLDGDEKTIVLSIEYRNGSFYIHAGEFDRHFDQFGPIESAEVVQRDMLDEAAARLAMNCWTPVGQIVSTQDDKFVVHFANLPRLLSTSKLSRLDQGAVLQLYRETINDNQLRQDAHPSQFLAIESLGANAVVAAPIGDAWDRDWFQYLDDARARYLVRRVTPRTGVSRLQVLLTGTVPDQPDILAPRGGCDVYLHDQPSPRLKINSNIAAVTQRNGLAEFQVDHPKPIFVTVAYENQAITQPFVRGVSPEPLIFQFRYLGNQGDYLTSLKGLHDQLRANAAKINQLVATISNKAKESDEQTIRQLSNEALQLANVDSLVDQAEAIDEAAKVENLDLSEAMKSFRKTIDDMNAQTARLRADMAMAERFAAAESSLKTIQEAFDAMRWAEALALLERFAVEFPGHPQSGKLDRFRSAARAVNSTHAAARQRILDARTAQDISALTARWSAISQAIENLLSHDDALYLSHVNQMRDRWQQLVNDEIQSIKSDNVAAAALQGSAQDKAVAVLKQRVADLSPVRQDLERLGPQILAAAQKSKDLLAQ